MKASVNYVGNSSLVVGIKVLSENIKTHSVKHTNSSYFTMVALNEESQKPVTVPGLILQDEAEVRRFIAALHRKELNRYYKQESSRIKSQLVSQDYLDILQKERCLLKING